MVTIALPVRRMLMMIMLVSSMHCLLRRRRPVLRKCGRIVVLTCRVCTVRHGNRQHAVTSEPEHHPSDHEQAQRFHEQRFPANKFEAEYMQQVIKTALQRSVNAGIPLATGIDLPSVAPNWRAALMARLVHWMIFALRVA